MSIAFLFAWYDLWIGAYWDKTTHWLYILPIPCCGIILKFSPRLLKVKQITGNGKWWYIVGPDGVQMGPPFGGSRGAYTTAWTMWRLRKYDRELKDALP